MRAQPFALQLFFIISHRVNGVNVKKMLINIGKNKKDEKGLHFALF